MEWAAEDQLVLPTRIPNDVLYGKQWALQRVGAEAAWDLSVGGPAAPAAALRLSTLPGGAQLHGGTTQQAGGDGAEGNPWPPQPPAAAANLSASARLGTVTVCVVDSGEAGRDAAVATHQSGLTKPAPHADAAGIDHLHPQLAGAVAPEVGWNALDPGQPPADGLGHGTHVAGVVAASADDASQVAGLTWGAAAGSAVRLLACKFMSDQVKGGGGGALLAMRCVACRTNTSPARKLLRAVAASTTCTC